MMASLATLQTWLSEAEIARHKLRTGAKVATMSVAGRTLSYTQANAAELDAYIADLTKQIAEAQGGTNKRRVFRLMQTGTGF